MTLKKVPASRGLFLCNCCEFPAVPKFGYCLYQPLFILLGQPKTYEEIAPPFAVVIFLLFIQGVTAQTLINRAWKDRTGHPTLAYNFIASMKDTAGNVYYVGNTYHLGEQENYLISKYQANGSLVWQQEFNSVTGDKDFGADIYIKGDYVYVAGTSWDSAGNTAMFWTLKLNRSDGNEVWSQKFQGAYLGLTVASAIKVDEQENVFVAGTDQKAAAQFQIAVVKYDSTGSLLWDNYYYDTAAYNGAVAMLYDADKDEITVTGYAGNTFTNWSIVTVQFDGASGAIGTTGISNNGNGNIDKPVAITNDYNGNLYVLGTTIKSPTNTDWKLIKYDTLLNEVWVKTFGGPDSLMDEPTGLAVDNLGQLVISGNASKANGATDGVVIRVDLSGNVLWGQTMSAQDLTRNCKANDIVVGLDNNIYIAGQINNGSNDDYVTASYDLDGKLRWMKTYNDTVGSNDIAKDIQVDGDGNIFVSGISTSIDTQYLTLFYTQWERTTSFVMDTDTIAIYALNNIILRFDTSVIDFGAVDNEDIVYGTLDRFLRSDFVDTLNNKLPDLTARDCYLVKLAPHYHTWDTILISNIGDTIPIPPFWTEFLLVYHADSSEQYYADSLKKMWPQINVADLNVTYRPYCNCTTACPDDPQYALAQTALHDGVDPNGNIDAETAWPYETGKPFVKVGVFDSPIEWSHEDFMKTSSISKVAGGYDYAYSHADLYFNQNPDFQGHGTEVAGVIGALRSNGVGIAGVAGGNWCNMPSNDQSGASLFSFGVGTPAPQNSVAYACADIIQALNDALSNNIGITYSNMAIFNFSFGASEFDPNILLFKQKLYYAWRLGKIDVASRGNKDGQLVEIFPSCYNDDWMLNVGGSSTDGAWSSPSLYGHGMDVLAPFESSMIMTTGPNNTYVSDGGTTFSAAYATGYAALLLSYLNDPNDPFDYDNLAPEDVEEIMQRTAWLHPGYNPPYDPFGGYGRIDIGAGLRMVDKTTSRLMHFASSNYSPTKMLTQESVSDIDLNVKDPIPYSNIPAGLYKAEVWKLVLDSHHNIVLQPGESIAGYWARSSSSYSFPLYTTSSGNNYLDPYERAYVDEANDIATTNSATIWGYYYKLKDYNNPSTVIGWVPNDPNATAYNRMDYTIYLTTAPVSAPHISLDGFFVSAFPNPAQSSFTLTVEGGNKENYEIYMVNALGQKTKTLFNGIISTLTQTFSCSDLQNGVYSIICQGRTNKKEIKIVINN